MFPKLLAISGVARVGAPVRSERDTRARARTLYFPAANIRSVPRLHAPLECRWRIDPKTGALSAFWLDPSAIAGTRAAAESEFIDARRRFAQFPRAARGYPAPRFAA
jgi:hypothetical protein